MGKPEEALINPGVPAVGIPAGSVVAHLHQPGPDRGCGSMNSVRWKTFTNSRITDSPAVSGGLVYAGSFDHNLYAMNASTGNIQWVASTEDAIASSPTVVDGVVYVGSDKTWKPSPLA